MMYISLHMLPDNEQQGKLTVGKTGACSWSLDSNAGGWNAWSNTSSIPTHHNPTFFIRWETTYQRENFLASLHVFIAVQVRKSFCVCDVTLLDFEESRFRHLQGPRGWWKEYGGKSRTTLLGPSENEVITTVRNVGKRLCYNAETRHWRTAPSAPLPCFKLIKHLTFVSKYSVRGLPQSWPLGIPSNPIPGLAKIFSL